jgi:hypothetical protein
MWKKVLASYSRCLTNFEASGKHNGHDFWNYCQNDRDVLYLELALAGSDTELRNFCAAGTVIPFGLDTSNIAGSGDNGSAAFFTTASNKTR